MMDSPIKWLGGKSRMREAVIARLPSHACYVEVFGGAGWVLFAKNPSVVEVFNDFDGDLMNFWRVVKWRPAELSERLFQNFLSRETFNLVRDASYPNDEISRAEAIYMAIRLSFGGTRRGFLVNRTEKVQSFLRYSDEALQKASVRLRDVLIENLDFERLIKTYDSEETCFFCDPPYFGTEGYKVGFTLEDHKRLSVLLQNIKGKFLLTINDTPEIRETYPFPVEEYLEARSVSNVKFENGRDRAQCLIYRNFTYNTHNLFGDER
jgi:DNA adenine methylase